MSEAQYQQTVMAEQEFIEEGKQMNIYKRINAARKQFHAINLKKTGHNKFAGYYYFELGDFLIQALKVFADNGLMSIVYFDVNMAYMDIVNVDEPKEIVKITSPMGSAALKGCHEVQNIGACETYQRRYLWVAALEIVEHDQLDASEPLKPVKPASAKPVSVDVFENMDDDEKEFLQNLATDVRFLLSKNLTQSAVNRLESENLTADEKVAIWSLFDSKQRSSMKSLTPTAEGK
jgi:hypothetical protein